MLRPSVLCPVDFSEASQGALRFAAAIAEHFFAGLTVATVDDPLPAGRAGAADHQETLAADRHQDLARFIDDTFPVRKPTLAELHLEVAAGKPATEIQRIALERCADLIVMSTHGQTVVRKFFGSTTERVLRETSVPVLVTPAGDPGPATIEDLKGRVSGVLAPVDFSANSGRQVRIAHGLADAFQASLVLLRVLEPLPEYAGRETFLLNIREARRHRARQEFEELMASLRYDVLPEMVITDGDPAEQIARLAAELGSVAIVMGLHSTSDLGPRMGSVTYRVLCQTATPVLALPPSRVTNLSRRLDLETAAVGVAGRYCIR